MHLVINATELGRQRGGNESYIRGVIDGLATLQPDIQITLLTCDWGRDLTLPDLFRVVNLGRYQQLPFFLWQQTQVLRQLNADWYLANYFLPPILPCKGAVMVHDLSFRAHPDYYPPLIAWYMRWLTGWAIRQASQILTGSEFSRREIARFYAIKPAHIINIPHGIAPQYQPRPDTTTQADELAILARYGVTPPYIFALGNIHPRKNLGRLLNAYCRLKETRIDIPTMVWGGLQRWESNTLVTEAQAAGIILPGFIDQADLPTFYRQAKMLVYPSLYEGFGLPPVEAMACGTPVITSNTTSLPEVVGDAGLTVDPTDSQALATAMAQLLDDTTLRHQLHKAGLAQVQQFRWEKTAKRLLDVLETEPQTT